MQVTCFSKDQRSTVMDYEFARSFLKPKTTGNYLLDLNPLSKLNLLFVIGFSAFIVQVYAYGFVLSVIYLILAFASGQFKPFFQIYWKIAVLFTFFLFLVRAAFSGGEHVLYELWGIRVTTESILTGLNSASLVLAFSGAFILFVKITPVKDLMYALEKKGMSHVASFIVLSSFQSIADLSENAKVIMESQKARGIETDGNLVHRMKAYIPVIGPLVLNAITGTEEKTIAMDARAFSAKSEHTFLCDLKPVPGGEKLLVIVFDVALFVLIAWRALPWVL